MQKTLHLFGGAEIMFVFNSLVTHQPPSPLPDLFPHRPFPQGSLPLALPSSIILARHNDYVYMELNCPRHKRTFTLNPEGTLCVAYVDVSLRIWSRAWIESISVDVPNTDLILQCSWCHVRHLRPAVRTDQSQWAEHRRVADCPSAEHLVPAQAFPWCLCAEWTQWLGKPLRSNDIIKYCGEHAVVWSAFGGTVA